MLLAFDLDNTVVTGDHRLPGEIVRAIDAVRSAGHQVAGGPAVHTLPPFPTSRRWASCPGRTA